MLQKSLVFLSSEKQGQLVIYKTSTQMHMVYLFDKIAIQATPTECKLSILGQTSIETAFIEQP